MSTASDNASLDLPEGLIIIENFISEKREKMLIECIDAEEYSSELSRRTQQYGYRYNYKSGNSIEKIRSLPEWNNCLIAKLQKLGVITTPPMQAIINEYLPGQGIAAHVDSLIFGEPIISIGLGGSCVMHFKNKKTNESYPLKFNRRIAIVLTGPARYDYTHEIKKVKYDNRIPRERRISITYRDLRSLPPDV